jgi:hypothetical protein
MYLAGKGIQVSTTDSLSRQTRLATNDQGLTNYELVALLSRYGIRSYVDKALLLEKTISEIDHERPVIALIHYGSISKRQNLSDKSGHFVLVVGYEPNEYIIVKDPDFWGSNLNKGDNFHIPIQEYKAGLALSPAPFTGICFRDNLSIGDAHTVGVVNLRESPAGKRIGQMNPFENCTVLDNDRILEPLGLIWYQWVKIQTSDGIIAWCAENLLIEGKYEKL